MIGFALPLGLILAASTTADVVTTRTALSNCSTCREGNVLMRPFAGNTIALTVVQGGANTGMFFLALHYREKHRKTWWVPVVAITAFHVYAAVHNSRAPNTRE